MAERLGYSSDTHPTSGNSIYPAHRMLKHSLGAPSRCGESAPLPIKLRLVAPGRVLPRLISIILISPSRHPGTGTQLDDQSVMGPHRHTRNLSGIPLNHQMTWKRLDEGARKPVPLDQSLVIRPTPFDTIRMLLGPDSQPHVSSHRLPALCLLQPFTWPTQP